MNFHLNMRCDSAAFHDEIEGDFKPEVEVARILRAVADKVMSGEFVIHDNFGTSYETIFDVNGNDVGRFALKPEGS